MIPNPFYTMIINVSMSNTGRYLSSLYMTLLHLHKLLFYFVYVGT